MVAVQLLRGERGISAGAGGALSHDVAGLSNERFVVGLAGIHEQFSTTTQEGAAIGSQAPKHFVGL